MFYFLDLVNETMKPCENAPACLSPLPGVATAATAAAIVTALTVTHIAAITKRLLVCCLGAGAGGNVAGTAWTMDGSNSTVPSRCILYKGHTLHYAKHIQDIVIISHPWQRDTVKYVCPRAKHYVARGPHDAARGP